MDAQSRTGVAIPACPTAPEMEKAIKACAVHLYDHKSKVGIHFEILIGISVELLSSNAMCQP